MPITERFGIRGELFTGEAMGTFLGGIGQSINPVTLEPIQTRGGWGEILLLLGHAAYTATWPTASTIPSMATSPPADGPTTSSTVANIMYDVTKKFRLGLEVGQLKTLYNGLNPGECTRFEFMARYGF